VGLLDKVKHRLGDDHIKMLNLGYDWLTSYLPFVLGKVNRVHFGLLQPHDIQQLQEDGVKIPTSRKLVAVPFVAKDVPSRASEFAHPDILIGLTILAYRYEGLRKTDFDLLMKFLKDCMDDEGGLFPERPSCLRFEQWVLYAGKAIRGSKRKGTLGRKNDQRLKNLISNTNTNTSSVTITSSSTHSISPRPPAPTSPTTAMTALPSPTNGSSSTASSEGEVTVPGPKKVSRRASTLYSKDAGNGVSRAIGINIFSEMFIEEDDLIWPLHLIDPKDREQNKVIYPLLYKLPHVVMFYLNDIIFPEVLAHQGLKISSCGQELGGDMLFGRRIGFSGTPSDILPQELGSCQYERGSDGRVVHYLTSPSICQFVNIAPGWDVQSLLDFIATSTQPRFHALIDTGALITGLSNKDVAEYLLRGGLSEMKGVVFLDELDRQMVLLRKGFKVVKLADSGLAWSERFTFYDQVHTTGMDIKQTVDACAALTLGKDMVFRDYAQGSFRMRGIGKGQTIKLLVVPEIADRIKTQVSIGGNTTVKSVTEVSVSASPDEIAQHLKDVVSWLMTNSMRVDGVQYNLLCEQSVSNIWRKRCFNGLLSDYKLLEEEKCPPNLNRSLQVYRERIDFEIENSVPVTLRYSEKIATLINGSYHICYTIDYHY
jgi:hypothetical protein